MNQPLRLERRVEFCDTDAAGIAHFSSFFTWMEQAEHEYLRRCGLSVLMRDEQGPISWPRVSTKCDFSGAVRFEDVLAIDVSIARLGTKSATYAFEFTCDGRAVARGEMTSVCCRLSDDRPPQGIEIPASIRERLRFGPTTS